MKELETEVLVVGAGGDGPALAWGLGERDVEVLVLEAGPWHGHERSETPHDSPFDGEGKNTGELSGELLDEQFTGREYEMNNIVGGKLRWGPADRSRSPWFRVLSRGGMALQVAGVGGTTLHYFGNHPRAYPGAVEEDWPIDYGDLVPYYQLLEEKLPVRPAPTTPRDEVFYEGCRRAGWDLLEGKNVTEPGYRPMPNAVLRPDPALSDPDYDGSFRYPDVEGSTLSLSEYQGDSFPRGAPLREKSKRSTNVSFVPDALETGNVRLRPNAFVTRVHTDGSGRATGATYRNTWTGEEVRVNAEVVVLAAGCVETPRLWLKSDLPRNEHVGTGLTTHWLDFVSGTFEPETLQNLVGQDEIPPYQGQSGSARLDHPGLGAVAVNTFHPGITAGTLYGFSQSPFEPDTDPDGAPWDTEGKLGGRELKERMAKYPRTLSLIIHTDDQPHEENRIRLDSLLEDEHGAVPRIRWEPDRRDSEKRRRLAELGTEVLREAGANEIHRTNSVPILLHLQSSMRMGKVTDEHCEARDVKRLFVADHSVLANSLGGPNPTHTGQALSLRTADAVVERYFPNRDDGRPLPDLNTG